MAVDEDRIQRSLRGYVKAVAARSPETDIRYKLWDWNTPYKSSVRRVDQDRVAARCPDIAVTIDAKSVEKPHRAIREKLRFPQRCAIWIEGVSVNGSRRICEVRCARIGDIEKLFIWRKSEAVWPHSVRSNQRYAARLEVKSIDVRRPDFAYGSAAFVFTVNPVGGIREPNGAVRFHNHVVGRIEALSLEVRRDRPPSPVKIKSRDPSPTVLARENTPFSVDRMPVVIANWRLKYAYVSVVLAVSEDAVIRDVRPKQMSGGRHVNRPLGPSAPCPKLFEFRVADDERIKALVEDFKFTHTATAYSFSDISILQFHIAIRRNAKLGCARRVCPYSLNHRSNTI